jgi:hypothetical protein
VAVEENYGDDVRFVGVPGQAEEDSMRDFVSSTGTDVIDHIPDLDGNLWLRFGVRQQRTYVFINDDGTWRTSGYGSLEQDVQDLIAQ